MIYLLGRNETFTIFYKFEAIPEYLQSEVIEIESLPEGEGILRQDGNGSFYYESFQSLDPIEPDPLPSETIDEKLARMEQQLQEQQQQNLILVDINLTVYEELLNMKEQFALLNGTKDNA